MFRRRRGPITISTAHLWIKPAKKQIAWHEIVPDLMAIFGFFGILYLFALAAMAIEPYTRLGTFIAERVGS